MSSSSSLTIPMINELLTSYDNEFSEISQSVHQLIQQLSSSSGNRHDTHDENDDDESFEVIQRKIKRQFNSLEHIIQNMETQLSTIQYNQQQQQQFSNFMIMDDDDNHQQIGMVAQSWRRRIDEQYKRQLHSLKVQYQDTIHNLLTPSSSSNEHHQHEIDIYGNYANNNNYGENSKSEDDSDSDSDDDDHLSYTTTHTKKSWFASSKKSNSTMDRDRLLSNHHNHNSNSHNTKNFYNDNSSFDGYKSNRDETKRLIKQSSNSLNRSLEIARSIEHTGTRVMDQLSDQRSVLERARSQLDVTRDEMVEGSRVLSRMEWRDWVQRVVIVLVILILVLFIVGYLVYQIRRMIG